MDEAPVRALVTGASHGVSRGVAEALGEIDATVYLTGRDERALEDAAALDEA
jgi:short-subunit dehydrogenase